MFKEQVDLTYNFFSCVSADVLASRLNLSNAELDAQDKQFITSMLADPRYRTTLTDFLRLNPKLNQEQKINLALFTGLVTWADDLTDQIDQIPTSRQELADYLLNTTFPGKPHLIFKELYERFLKRLENHPDDQALVENFFESSLDRQLDNYQSAGTYDFETVWQYRLDTTGAYCETASRLAGVTDRQAIEAYRNYGLLWQFIDDVLDLKRDIRDQSLNLVVGMAHDIEEAGLLPKQDEISTGTGKISGWLTYRQLPFSRIFYQAKFNNLLEQLHPGPEKDILHFLQKILL